MDTTLESGFSADPESLKFPYINQITNTTNQNIELRFEATRKIWKDLNEVILNLDLAGLPKLKAVNQIEKILEFKKKPKIEISPSWWQWMPLLPARISVGYQEFQTPNTCHRSRRKKDWHCNF
jgi:hypothetical protein